MKCTATFGERLREYRTIYNNYTFADLERMTSIPAQTLNRYELGQRVPKVNSAGEIARLLNVDALWLQGYDVPFAPYDTSPLPLIFDFSTTTIPVYASIPAGVPMEALDNITEHIDIPASWTKGGKVYFGLIVVGDSMFPEYLDGDIVIIRRQETCESGDDCAVYVNGYEATLKRVKLHSDGSVTLQPLNPNYAPRTYSADEVQNCPVGIAGVVEEIRRRKRK